VGLKTEHDYQACGIGQQAISAQNPPLRSNAGPMRHIRGQSHSIPPWGLHDQWGPINGVRLRSSPPCSRCRGDRARAYGAWLFPDRAPWAVRRNEHVAGRMAPTIRPLPAGAPTLRSPTRGAGFRRFLSTAYIHRSVVPSPVAVQRFFPFPFLGLRTVVVTVSILFPGSGPVVHSDSTVAVALRVPGR